MNHEKHLRSILVPFYLGEGGDLQGRKIQQIWAWNFEKLECVHDYIQWLFPLSEKSAFNSNAPIVDEDTIAAFQKDVRLRQNLWRSLTVMLRFYGLQRHEDKEGKITIERSKDYSIRKTEWLCLFDHNYLRITRILKCLIIFGLENEALAFYKCLQEIYCENSDRIGSKTFQYWTNTVKNN